MGGTGGIRWSSSSSRVNRLLEQSNSADARARYESEVNSLLRDALSYYTQRDAGTIRRHLDALKHAIQRDIDGTVDLLFGGSARRHTYVNGLSDVDILVRVNNSSLVNALPREVLNYLARRIRERLPNTQVTIGQLAVTISYADDHEVQLLPAIASGSGYRIADPDGEGWSNVIRPDKFAGKLTSVNQQCNGMVVRIVKLFKSMQTVLPEASRLSGYHVESLAVEVFKRYSGSLTYKDMLGHFCREAVSEVMLPIADSTGQSLHVDDYLGAADSTERQRVSHSLQNLVKRIESADRRCSTDEWESLVSGE